MTITLNPEIERALLEAARQQSKTAEELIMETLRAAFIPPPTPASFPYKARDEWEAIVLSVATDCGISLSNEALSSEGIYETPEPVTEVADDVQQAEMYLRDLEKMIQEMRSDQREIDRLRDESRSIQAHTDVVMAQSSEILARIRESK